jgi:PAS domain-containing protein
MAASPSSAQPPARVDLERLRAGEELRGEPREFRRGDGSVTVLRRWARALHSGDGDVMGVFALLEDMAQTLAAERRGGPGAFRSVFEEHSEPLFVVDPHHDDIMDANPPACVALGYSREELGTPPTLMDDQMGHSDGSVQARYAHATAEMVRRLLDGLTTVWEAALAARRQLSPGSPVAVLDGLLRNKIVSQISPQQLPETVKGRSASRDTGPDLAFYRRADRI